MLAATAHAVDVTLLNVSYDPTRELWRDINANFTRWYEKEKGVRVTIRQSHGGSSTQARAVIDGLDADVVTLASYLDDDAISKKGLIKSDWVDRLPNRSLPYTSTVVFVVRKGNPKQIKDWQDLVKPGISIITPNPKTSGNGYLSFFAAFGSVIVRGGSRTATEELNRNWYQRNTGRTVGDVQRRVRHSAISWMVATLDGIVSETDAVFEAKFMLPWSFSEEAAAEKYMAQLQHNMWVTHLRTSVLSIITGGGKWVEITIPMDPLYLAVLVSAEKKFWRCVQSGEPPHLINAEPPRPRLEVVRIVDMSSSNSWAEFAALFRNTRSAFLEHEQARTELKALMPEDAKEAIGHGIRAKRSKSGAVSFDLLEGEGSHAAVQ
jgi:accessory colonization factor AcfC